MLLRSFVVVGFIMIASAGASRATAQDLRSSASLSALDGVSFADLAPKEAHSDAPFEFAVNQTSPRNTRDLGRDGTMPFSQGGRRAYEFSLAHNGVAGLPVDVEIAQRATIGLSASGDVESHGRGSELRLGQGLGGLRRAKPASWSDPRYYMFVAADDEALTWTPHTRNAFGGTGPSVALQDRVEIGDMQVGVTYEAGPLQASFAYVERDVSSKTGGGSLSHAENFTGLTLTLRH